MLRVILFYGVIGGLIVAAPMLLGLTFIVQDYNLAMFVGYAIMLVALSTVFIAIKDYRDKTLGGVIKFLPALGIGLGITLVAGLFYAGGFELYLLISGSNHADDLMAQMVAAERAKGDAAAIANMENMQVMYRNPLFRMAVSLFMEFAPVGIVVSVISAALLRNSRFMPANGPIV